MNFRIPWFSKPEKKTQVFTPVLKPISPAIDVIGKGSIGPKAKCLFDDKERILKAGIEFPKFIPITSDIFDEVAGESGALGAKSEIEALRCLNRYVLSPALFSQISEAALSFKKQSNGGRAVIVRTDDYALGLGLTYSGGAAITFEQDEKLFVSRILQQLRRSWASCLSENFQIFAQMKGLTEIGATVLMPVFGAPVMQRKDAVNDMLYTPISINFLGYFGDFLKKTAIFSVGAGIGGANRQTCSTRFRGTEIKSSVLVHSLEHASPCAARRADENTPRVLDMTNSRMAPSTVKLNVDMIKLMTVPFYRNLDENTREINNQVSCFASDAQRYAEFVVPSFDSPQLTIVQTSPVHLTPARKPNINGKSIILESKFVVGSSSVSTINVRFAGSTPTKEDVSFNKENKNYLLVIDSGISSWHFKWELKHLHNAGAVVICVNQPQASYFDFSTHLSGYFRELGIPVIGAGAESAAAFRKKIGPASHCLVFADEFSSNGGSEGFVALV